jgi:4-hydroxybenzoyl-CoA thioesterase
MPAFEYSAPVRFADVDHAGIVYYPRFFHYFHVAFEELWRARLGSRAYVNLLDNDRVGFPAVRAECDYRAPLRFGDTATIAVSVTKLGGKSIRFRYLVFRERETIDGERLLCAEGIVVCAVVDLRAFVAIDAPDVVHRVLHDLVELPAMK